MLLTTIVALGLASAQAQTADPKVAPSLQLPGHFGAVTSLVQERDGSWLSAGADGLLFHWSATGQALQQPTRFDPSAGQSPSGTRTLGLTSLAVSPSGQIAVAQRASGPVLWMIGHDATVQKPIGMPGRGSASIGWVAFAPSGKYLLVSDGVGGVHLRDPNAPGVDLDVFTFPSAQDSKTPPAIVALAADRQSDEFLCVAQTDGGGANSTGAEWIALKVDKNKLKADGAAMPIQSVAPNFLHLAPISGGQFLIAGAKDQAATAAILTAGSQTEAPLSIAAAFPNQDYPDAICADASGKHLAFGSALGQIIVTDLTGKPSGPPLRQQQKIAVSELQFAEDGKSLVYGSYDGSICSLGLKGAQPLEFAGYTGYAPITSLTWANSNHVLMWSPIASEKTYAFDLDTTTAAESSTLKPSDNDHQANSAYKLVKDSKRGLVVQSTTSDVVHPVGGNAAVFTSQNRFAAASSASIFQLQLQDDQLSKVGQWVAPTGAWALAVSPDGKFLAAAGMDGFIRVYHSDPSENGGKPMATIFMNPAQEWVCFDEASGTYSCSVNGDQLFGYQVAQGDDPKAEFVSAKAMTGPYRKPGWTGAVLSGDTSVTDQSTPASKAAGNAPLVKYEVLQPAVLQPDGWYEVPKGTTEIQVQVSAAGSQKCIFRMPHGYEPAKAKNLGIEDKVTTQTMHGQLDQDSNEDSFRLSAESFDGAVTSDPIYIKVRRPLDASTQGTLHILAVGVGDFPADAGLEKLYGPESDAQSFADVMKSADRMPSGIKSVANPVILLGKNATKQNVMDELNKLLKVAKGDRVLFFISSHGDTIEGHSIVAPYDYKKSDPVHSALDWQDMAATLGQIQCRSKVVFVDTCHAGGGGSKIEEVAAKEQESRTDTTRNLESNGVAVLASCQPSQNSYDDPQNHHGFFTKCLIDVLNNQGLAWAFQDVQTLALITHVQEALAHLNKAQTPALYAPTGVDFPVIKALQTIKVGPSQ